VADPAEERFKKQDMNMVIMGKSGKDIIRGLLVVCYAKGKYTLLEKLFWTSALSKISGMRMTPRDLALLIDRNPRCVGAVRK